MEARYQHIAFLEFCFMVGLAEKTSAVYRLIYRLALCLRGVVELEPHVIFGPTFKRNSQEGRKYRRCKVRIILICPAFVSQYIGVQAAGLVEIIPAVNPTSVMQWRCFCVQPTSAIVQKNKALEKKTGYCTLVLKEGLYLYYKVFPIDTNSGKINLILQIKSDINQILNIW